MAKVGLCEIVIKVMARAGVSSGSLTEVGSASKLI